MGKKDIDLAIKHYPQHAASLSTMPTTKALEDRIHHYHLPYQRARQLWNQKWKHYTIAHHRSRSTHPHRQTNQEHQITYTAKWTFLEKTGNLQTGPIRPLDMPYMLQTYREKGLTPKLCSLPRVNFTTLMDDNYINASGDNEHHGHSAHLYANGRGKPDKRSNRRRNNL